MKKVLAVALCVMAMVGLAVSAEAAFYVCTIQQAGSSGGIYVLQLTDTGSTFPAPRYFMIDPAIPQAKEMLAAALTAWASNGKVQVNIPNVAEWNVVLSVIAMQ